MIEQEQTQENQKNSTSDSVEPNVLVKEEGGAKKTFNPFVLLSLLAVVVAIIAIFEVAFFYQQTHKKLEQQASQLKHQEIQQTQIEKQVAQMAALDEVHNQTQLYLKTQVLELNNRLNDPDLSIRNQLLNFKLEQIHQLLQQAQLSVYFLRNIPDAVGLLQLASHQLSQLNQPEMLPFQSALVQTILALRALPMPDDASLLARINAVSERLLTLSLVNTKIKFAPLPQLSPVDGIHAPLWKIKLKESLHQLGSLIVIRHHQQAFEPMLPPAEEQALRATLTQLLDQAAWAILHHNQRAYHWSLVTTNQLLDRYFYSSSDLVVVHQEILQLLDINVQPENPNLETLLHQYVSCEEKIRIRLGISG